MNSIAFNIASPIFQEYGQNGGTTQPAVQHVAVARWRLDENVCLNRKIALEKIYASETVVLISVQVRGLFFKKFSNKNFD